jgi:hypothetical protein
MNSLSDLIAYVITKLNDMEVSFGKTKLIKLLYLIDVETYKISLHTLTGLNWIFYHYGPYAFEVDDALKQLELDIPQEDVKTSSGYKAKIFKPSRYLFSEFEKSTVFEKMLVDRVLGTWGPVDLNILLNYVYFHTEPMENAVRGSILDFSTVQRSPPIRPAVVLNVDSKVHEQLRQRFLQASQKRASSKRLEPRPRFDNLFIRAFSNLYAEEHFMVSPGDVEIKQESKKEIWLQSEKE